jgi:hypothetical protein
MVWHGRTWHCLQLFAVVAVLITANSAAQEVIEVTLQLHKKRLFEG